MKKLFSLCIIFIVFFLPGCTTFLSLTTDEPIEQDAGTRSFGTYLNDENIESIATVNIRKSDTQLADAHLNVESYNGMVLLTGQVNSNDLKSIAGAVADKVANVRKVYNELEVKDPSTTIARFNDSWLTSKIKTKMMADSTVQSGRIRVVTENGVVFLMGLVSHAEGERAVNLVQESYGVQRIIKVFEYID